MFESLNETQKNIYYFFKLDILLQILKVDFLQKKKIQCEKKIFLTIIMIRYEKILFNDKAFFYFVKNSHWRIYRE